MKYIRRVAVVFLLLSVPLLCAACGAESQNRQPDYPRLIYRSSPYYGDPNNQELRLGEGYKLSHSHPYDVVATDAGYDLVFHIEAIQREGDDYGD